MHDRIGPVALEDAPEGGGVADIGLLEGIARIAGDRRQGFGIGGIGQLVEIDDRRVRLGDQMAAERGADEAGPARHKNARGHQRPPS
jgi:hypothetical protein